MKESSSERLRQELEDLSQQQELTAHLLALLSEIHRSLSVRGVLDALSETLMNLIGTEDFAIFVYDEVTDAFEKLVSVGPGADQLSSFSRGEGAIGAVVDSGRIRYGDPVATVPLRGRMYQGAVAVLVVVSLLAHRREGLVSRDYALFELFSEHGGAAMEAAYFSAAGAARTFSVARLKAMMQVGLSGDAEGHRRLAWEARAERMMGSIVVRCAERFVALPVVSVAEVFRMVSIVGRLPGAPDHCMGLVDCRGRLVPVCDLAARLGFRQRLNDVDLCDGHVVVLRYGDGYVGYAVDELQELNEEEAQEVASEDTAVFGELVIGTVRLRDGNLAPLLDEVLLASGASNQQLDKAVAASADLAPVKT